MTDINKVTKVMWKLGFASLFAASFCFGFCYGNFKDQQ